MEIISFYLEKKSRHIENLQSRLDDCEKEQKEILNKSEEVKMQECESPCTISRNENNDLITLSDVQNKNEKLKDENESLSQRLETVSESLKKCENPETQTKKKSSKTLVSEFLS